MDVIKLLKIRDDLNTGIKHLEQGVENINAALMVCCPHSNVTMFCYWNDTEYYVCDICDLEVEWRPGMKVTRAVYR